jgi:hypothetical protein
VTLTVWGTVCSVFEGADEGKSAITAGFPHRTERTPIAATDRMSTPQPPTEESDMIQLRPTVAEDLPDLLGWVDSEAEMVLWSGLTFSWPLDLEQLDASPT